MCTAVIKSFITQLKLPWLCESICNSPLNYSTLVIHYGQVPSVSWYGPEGFMMRSALHSAPEVLQRIYLETWSLSWGTLGWGTYLALQLTDVTLFPFFLIPSFQPLFLCILSAFILSFLLYKWRICFSIQSWPEILWGCCRFYNHFQSLKFCAFLHVSLFISHPLHEPNDITGGCS